MPIFQEVLFVPRRHTVLFFQAGDLSAHQTMLFSKKPCLFVKHMPSSRSPCLFFSRTHNIFPGNRTSSSNTYEFSRSLYFLIEQISIFQKALSNHRTNTISRRPNAIKQNRHRVRLIK